MWNWALRSLVSNLRTPHFSSLQTLKCSFSIPLGALFPPAGRLGARALEDLFFSSGPLRGARLAGAQRQDPVALCFGGPAARTRAPVNGLSKDNFCFSFAVGSCPATSNEKCAFSRDSGAGDLCGNRTHSRGLGCSAGLRGWRAGAVLEENLVPRPFQRPLLWRPPPPLPPGHFTAAPPGS